MTIDFDTVLSVGRGLATLLGVFVIGSVFVFTYAKLAAYGWNLGCRRFELDYHKSPDERTSKDGDKKQTEGT